MKARKFNAASQRRWLPRQHKGTGRLKSNLHNRIEALEADLASLKNPTLVRLNILRGEIAIPDDLVWLHDTEGPVATLRARIKALEADLKLIADRSEPDGPGHLMSDRRLLRWVHGKSRAALTPTPQAEGTKE